MTEFNLFYLNLFLLFFDGGPDEIAMKAALVKGR